MKVRSKEIYGKAKEHMQFAIDGSQ